MATWFYVLVCLGNGCVLGQEIFSGKAFYSQSSCETDARLIAQGMYYPKKEDWGYKCVQLDHEPKKLEK